MRIMEAGVDTTGASRGGSGLIEAAIRAMAHGWTKAARATLYKS
jgi:hypothetical protein